MERPGFLMSERFFRALGEAARLHNEQGRKGTGIPYVSHLLAVCALVLEHGGQEDEAIAALLHDAVEDQGGPPTLEKIRQGYGETVARIVAGCTDADTIPKPPWLERKQRYLAHLPTVDAKVRLVSCADKLHNARSVLADYRKVGEQVWSRFNGTREQTLWYLRALADAFVKLDGTPLARELDRTVRELEAETAAGAPA
jgi:(p)ppGpp synthase/HD superfamily hydrolase